MREGHNPWALSVCWFSVPNTHTQKCKQNTHQLWCDGYKQTYDTVCIYYLYHHVGIIKMPKCQPTRVSKVKHSEILQAVYINKFWQHHICLIEIWIRNCVPVAPASHQWPEYKSKVENEILLSLNGFSFCSIITVQHGGGWAGGARTCVVLESPESVAAWWPGHWSNEAPASPNL